MRYYDFVLNTSAEKIKKDAKVCLRDYDYDSSIGAMNNYMFRNMKNGLNFFSL